jgi:hypothetical protein
LTGLFFSAFFSISDKFALKSVIVMCLAPMHTHMFKSNTPQRLWTFWTLWNFVSTFLYCNSVD